MILHSRRAGEGSVKRGREMKAGARLRGEACRLVLVMLWLAGQERWHVPQWAQHTLQRPRASWPWPWEAAWMASASKGLRLARG